MIQSFGQLCGWLGLAGISYTSQSTFPRKKLLNRKHLDLLWKLFFWRLEMKDLLMYKNRLQELTTRSDFSIPVYQTVNEGQPHDPKFRWIVWVAEISYTSQSTFFQKKDVEQEVFRLAFEIILQKTRDEGPSFFQSSYQLLQ